MAAGVSTVEARDGDGNTMLGEEKKPGPSPTPHPARVGRGRKQGRIRPRNFRIVFHNGIVMSYHLLTFAMYS